MYQFLDHPSEALIEVIAPTENEVFCDAGTALFELMTEVSKVEIQERFPGQLEAP